MIILEPGMGREWFYCMECNSYDFRVNFDDKGVIRIACPKCREGNQVGLTFQAHTMYMNDAERMKE